MSDHVVEESWTLVGERRGGTWRCRRLRHRTGQAASVTADGRWTMLREEARGDVIGFMHTHPMGGLHPSTRDVRTMRAWCDALGKSLLCVIATPDKVGAWRFDDYRSNGEPLANIELIGKTQLIGVETHARKVSPRAALPRRGTPGQTRRPPPDPLRRRRRRVQPG